MGCCQCKPEFRDNYQISPSNKEIVNLSFTLKKSDSFDDISIPSHNGSILASTIPNDPSYMTQNSTRSPPETPRPRSTSYSPLTRKAELEAAFLFSAPLFARHQNEEIDGHTINLHRGIGYKNSGIFRTRLSQLNGGSFQEGDHVKIENLSVNERNEFGNFEDSSG